MRRIIFIVAVLALVSFGTAVFAEELIIEKKVNAVTFKKDKNGNEYSRIIVSEKKELNGVAYNKDVSVMAFGDQVATVKTLKKGDTFKAVVADNNFRGNTSYQLLKLMPKQ